MKDKGMTRKDERRRGELTSSDHLGGANLPHSHESSTVSNILIDFQVVLHANKSQSGEHV